jgi:hypothetical protein
MHRLNLLAAQVRQIIEKEGIPSTTEIVRGLESVRPPLSHPGDVNRTERAGINFGVLLNRNRRNAPFVT